MRGCPIARGLFARSWNRRMYGWGWLRMKPSLTSRSGEFFCCPKFSFSVSACCARNLKNSNASRVCLAARGIIKTSVST